MWPCYDHRAAVIDYCQDGERQAHSEALVSGHADFPLFTITDGSLDLNTDASEFETRLVHGLLLEPGLFMGDAYFFSSANLKDHVLGRGQDSISLFEEAMKRGLIIPALRQPAKDFKAVLGYLRDQQMRGHYDELDPLAERLSGSYDLGAEANRVIWPLRSGVGYERLVQHCLLGQQPSGVDSGIWQLTESLRHDGVVEAKRLTMSLPGGEGLRRGELIRVAGSLLGVFDLSSQGTIGRDEILSRYARLVGEKSIRHVAAREFFDWIDDIHRVNFAISLGARPSVFTSTPSGAGVLQRAMPSAAEEGSSQSVRDQISHVIEIPQARLLLKWPPEKLLGARDFGEAWRDSAQRFLDDPNNATRHKAEVALDEYAGELRKLAPASPPVSLAVQAFATKAAPTLFTAASGFALTEAGPYVATTASTGYLAYQYLEKGRPEEDSVSPGLNIIESSSPAAQ
jgi:hypothetical protein